MKYLKPCSLLHIIGYLQILLKGQVSQHPEQTWVCKYESTIREGEISTANSQAAPRRLREGKNTYQKPHLYCIYFSSCPSIPYAPNSKIKWILWAHKYFASSKINLKAILSFLYPSNVKQLFVSVHLNY